jgi:hypothetical protein
VAMPIPMPMTRNMARPFRRRRLAHANVLILITSLLSPELNLEVAGLTLQLTGLNNEAVAGDRAIYADGVAAARDFVDVR